MNLSRKKRGVVKRYIRKVTGYSRSQVTRLLGQYVKTGEVKLRVYQRNKFNNIYSHEEVILLAKTDELHNFPNGNSLKKILGRMSSFYGDNRFNNLSQLSVSHIYNLRKGNVYKQSGIIYSKTKPVIRDIAERRKPNPGGKPGFVRVDTVHQGDKDKVKGVYHINLVDEVTQFEFVGCVEQITEKQMIPILENLILQCPFRVRGFHTDNGSEYINKLVAKLLNRLLIKFTKSRSRKSNDNALVETKNGSVIRKWFGYTHIEQKYAPQINTFYTKYFNEYLNYHRHCAFSSVTTDKKGKVKKMYKIEDYRTPYQKFKRIKNYKKYLKPDVTIKMLNRIELRYTDNEIAFIVQDELNKLQKEVYS